MMETSVPTWPKQEALILARKLAEECATLCHAEAAGLIDAEAKERFWEALAWALKDDLPKPEPVVVRVPKDDLAQNQGDGLWASDVTVATMYGGKVSGETELAYYCEFDDDSLAWLPKSQATPIWGAQGKPYFDCVEMPLWLCKAKKFNYIDDE